MKKKIETISQIWDVVMLLAVIVMFIIIALWAYDVIFGHHMLTERLFNNEENFPLKNDTVVNNEVETDSIIVNPFVK